MNDLDIRMTAADSAKFLGVSLQFIHKQLKLKKLGSFKSQNRVYFGHATAKELFNIQYYKISHISILHPINPTSFAKSSYHMRVIISNEVRHEPCWHC